MPVIIFHSNEESQAFQDELRRSPITIGEQQSYTIEQNDPMVNELDRKIIAHSRAVNMRLVEWRATSA